MRWVPVLLAACTAPACDGAGVGLDAAPTADRMLVYTKANAFWHRDDIALASIALPGRMGPLGVETDITDDGAVFTAENLARYRAVFFMYTSGNDVLDVAGKEALEAYVRAGGGWLGIHSAADTEYSWPFYGELVVAHFKTHPATQQALIRVEEPAHPTMANLPVEWRFLDEWYEYRTNPRDTPGVQILATVDESTYSGGMMGADHPMMWCHELLGGRAFYSGIGHVSDAWRVPEFGTMIDNAVKWVMRRD